MEMRSVSFVAAKYPSWEREYRNWYRAGLDKEMLHRRARESYSRHRDAIKERQRKRYSEDVSFRDSAKRRALKYRTENSEHVKQVKAAYRERKREELAAKQLARYYANHAEQKRKNAERNKANREQNRAISRSRSASVTDGYAREQLSKYSPVSAWEWPQEIVTAKQTTLRIKRELKRSASTISK